MPEVGGKFQATGRRAGIAVAVLATLAILVATLWPADADLDDDGDVTPPPPFFCLACADRGTADVAANILMFLPLGAGLALAGVRPRRAMAAIVALTVTVELLQYTVIPGRDGALDDILSNTVGGLLGIGLALAGPRLLRPTGRLAAGLRIGALMAPTLLMAATSWLWQPELPATTWYGQWAPDLGTYAQFEGKVEEARLGQAPLPAGRLGDSESRRAELLRGGVLTLAARFTAAGPTPRMAPIVAVFDHREQRIVLLGQDGRALQFEARTRAEAYGLRSPSIVLRGALPAGDSADQTVTGVLYRGELSLERTSPAGRQSRVRPLGPAMGWALISPFDLQGDGVTALLSLAWMAALWLAWGYYGGLTETTARRWAGLLAPWVAALGIALLFGPPRLPWMEILGGTAGWAMGLGAGRAAVRSRWTGPTPRSAPGLPAG